MFFSLDSVNTDIRCSALLCFERLTVWRDFNFLDCIFLFHGEHVDESNTKYVFNVLGGCAVLLLVTLYFSVAWDQFLYLEFIHAQ